MTPLLSFPFSLSFPRKWKSLSRGWQNKMRMTRLLSSPTPIGDPLQPIYWIPTFAGMTHKKQTLQKDLQNIKKLLYYRHRPVGFSYWHQKICSLSHYHTVIDTWRETAVLPVALKRNTFGHYVLKVFFCTSIIRMFFKKSHHTKTIISIGGQQKISVICIFYKIDFFSSRHIAIHINTFIKLIRRHYHIFYRKISVLLYDMIVLLMIEGKYSGLTGIRKT